MIGSSTIQSSSHRWLIEPVMRIILWLWVPTFRAIHSHYNPSHHMLPFGEVTKLSRGWLVLVHRWRQLLTPCTLFSATSAPVAYLGQHPQWCRICCIALSRTHDCISVPKLFWLARPLLQKKRKITQCPWSPPLLSQ